MGTVPISLAVKSAVGYDDCMPRTARHSAGGICYHVINRGNARATVYHSDSEYDAFLDLMGEASERVSMRILAYCLMPNHFHLVLWPERDGDLSRWMQWLMTVHVRRHHLRHGSEGHVWQGRFKGFPIEQDAHLFAVLRYVERNPLRAGLVDRAEDWPWSSLQLRGRRVGLLHPPPLAMPRNWRRWVNQADSPEELEALRRSVNRGAPWGSHDWVTRTAKRLGLGATMRGPGRPRRSER